MPTIKDVIRETGELLAAHELGSELDKLWNVVQWEEANPPAAEDGVAISPATEPLIRLWPSLTENPKAAKSVLREFGTFLLRRGAARAEAIWTKKLSVPEEDHIEEFAQKLADPGLRQKCNTYGEIVQSYSTNGNSVPRLVAIHFSNALIANNVPYADSVGVNIRSWGPTSEFAAQQKYFSLIPLTSAYAPHEVHECFGCAFAELIVNDLSTVQDKSVQWALKGIIRNVVKRAED